MSDIGEGWIEPSDETTPKGECKLCNFVLVAVGLAVGSLFLYMSFDVLFGGKLTSVLGLGTVRTEVDE